MAEFRRNFDRTVFALIEKAEADPRLEDRTDILALLLRSRYEDGTPMSHQEISDELLTLLGAGHETTASTLGGRSSGCAATPASSASWSRRTTKAVTSSARPQLLSCNGTGPSSTSPAATC